MATVFMVGPDGTPAGGTGSDANPYRLADMIALLNAGTAGAFADTIFRHKDGVSTFSTDGIISNGGTLGHECIIEAQNDRLAIIRAATGTATNRKICFKLTTGSNANFIRWRNLVADGNFAAGGIGNLFIQTLSGANLHHHAVEGCRIVGWQGSLADFASVDYLTAINNTIYQNGKRQPGSDVPNSACSGISLNAKSAPYAYDSFQGFHNIIAGNKIAGQLGPTSDGNGVILDNGGAASDVLLQNTLVCRNVIYGCGGRGIHNLRCTAPQGHWIIGNTVFKNALDFNVTANSSGFGSEIDVQFGGPTYIVNNVAVAWAGTGNHGSTAFRDNGTSSNYQLYRNKQVVGRSSSPMTLAAGKLETITDPGFSAALTYNPDTIGDAYLVPDPDTIGDALKQTGSSVLVDSGIDPRTIAAMTAEMKVQLDIYLNVDLAGNPAPF